MKYRLNLFLSTLALVPLFMSVEAQANIYKCVNIDAEFYYNDKPCPVGDIERQIKRAKDPENDYIHAPFSISLDGEVEKNPSEIDLTVGGNTLKQDVSSSDETQSSQGNDNSAVAGGSENMKNSTEVSTKKTNAASEKNSATNATTSKAAIGNNNEKIIHTGIY